MEEEMHRCCRLGDGFRVLSRNCPKIALREVIIGQEGYPRARFAIVVDEPDLVGGFIEPVRKPLRRQGFVVLIVQSKSLVRAAGRACAAV